MLGAQKPENVLTKQRQIAEIAKRIEEPLTSLAHHIDCNWMREAWRQTRKDGAIGVDGMTPEDFETELGSNLMELESLAKSGAYQAPPSRRAYIPKDKGQRPIAIPCLADKVMQRAILMTLEPIYEELFYDCSFGFRRRRTAHQACSAIAKISMRYHGGYVVEADIKSFFDTLSQAHLRDFLSQRIADGVIRKLIDKWLRAGILEEGQLYRPDEGSIQGGVISPLLSNIYLHYVLDEWFHKTVKQHLSAPAELVRFADDFVIICKRKEDADKVMRVLPKRFEKFNLTLHPDKTRIIPFTKPWRHLRKADRKFTASWNFLGFTFYWGLSRKGKWIVRLKTAKDRFSRGLKRVNIWCKYQRHKRVDHQYRILMRKIRGHQAYFRVRGNTDRANAFQYEALKIWRKWLNRRSWKGVLLLEQFCWMLKRLEPLAPRMPKLVNL